MKKFFKTLRCVLFHKIEFIQFNFTDVVDGKPVNDYHCPTCNITFMANSKRNMWRCEKDKN